MQRPVQKVEIKKTTIFSKIIYQKSKLLYITETSPYKSDPRFHLIYSKNWGKSGVGIKMIKMEKISIFLLNEAILIHIQNILFYGEFMIINVKILVFCENFMSKET